MPERIVLVVKYQPPSSRISGVIGFVTPLAQYLSRNCDLHVVTSNVQGAPQHEMTNGYEVHRVQWPFPLSASRMVASLRPDVCVVVSSMYQLRRAAIYFGLFRISSSLLASRRLPSVFYQVTNPASSPRRGFRWLASSFDLLLCSTPEMAKGFSKALSQRVEVITPGVDVEKLSRIEASVETNGFRVGFMNHLNRVKGFDIALRVFDQVAARVPDIEFVIAGVGELENDVPPEIGGRPVYRSGWLPEDERLALIRSCDVMVLPFRTDKSVLGYSQTVLECLGLGVVVVGSNTASIAPVIHDGQDGFLMANAEDGASLLATLRDRPELRSQVSALGRDKVARDFDARERADRLLRLVLDVDNKANRGLGSSNSRQT